MVNGMSINIRPVNEKDLPACGRIIFDAFVGIADRHNFPRDFASPEQSMGMTGALLHNPKWFGVVAESEGKVVGSNFVDKRDAIRGVGPITVDPAFQQRGVGRRLMEAILDHSRDAVGVRLVQDAFNTTSFSLYTSLGFDVKEPLVLMRGKPKGRVSGTGRVRPMAEADIPACGDLGRRVHGFERTGALRDDLAHGRPFVLERGGHIVAYASNPVFWIMNHGVAETDADMFEQLLGVGAAVPQPIEMLVPSRRSALLRWCLGQGLRVVKPCTLMAIGEYREPQGAFYPSVIY